MWTAENRSFRVRVEGSLSDPVPAVSGVPQGSVLGPIIFLIIIDDLPDVLAGNVLLFADDVKLFAPRSQYNTTLQNLRAAFKWSEDFDLPLNAGECAHVSVGGPPPFPLSLADETAIPIVDCANDLGVTITADFKTSQHYREAANRARRVLFQMRRGFAV